LKYVSEVYGEEISKTHVSLDYCFAFVLGTKSNHTKHRINNKKKYRKTICSKVKWRMHKKEQMI